MGTRFRRVFFAGLFTVAPLALTVYLILILAGWFDALFQPVVQKMLAPYFNHEIPGLGIVIGVLFICVVGVFAPSFIGRQFIRLAEGILARLPLVKLVYSSSKQIFEAFSQSSSKKFSRVVMVPFPTSSSYAVGFVTTETEETWVPGSPDNKIAVFLPTTPNPTSGYLLFVRPQETVELPVTVEEGIRLVISGGLSKPGFLENKI